MSICQNLEFDVTRPFHEFLAIQVGVLEARFGLVSRAGESVGQVAVTADNAHAAPASTAAGFEHDGVPDALGLGKRLLDAIEHRAAGQERQPELFRVPSRGHLVAPGLHGLRRRPDEPHFPQMRENSAFSDKKPYPGWIASAAVISAALMIAGIFR